MLRLGYSAPSDTKVILLMIGNLPGDELGPQAPRTVSRGRAFVYVLPCRDRDLVKVGLARDPLRRFVDLHRRFHAFFDLERGLLVAVDTVAQARALERTLQVSVAPSRAAAPLETRAAAAGKTEWFAGIDPLVTAQARLLATAGGHEVIAPLRAWLARRLGEHADRAYDWAARLYEAMIEAQTYGQDARGVEDMLSLAIARYAAVGLPVRTLMPEEVLRWYEERYELLD